MLIVKREIVKVMVNVRDAEAVVVGALAVVTSAIRGIEVVVIACCPCTVPEIVAVLVSALTVSVRPTGNPRLRP